MSLTVVPVEFADEDAATNKDALKTQVQFFIGQAVAVKIEITKAGTGYSARFTARDLPPPAGAAVS
ncbi:MAG: hypothetical protein JWQ17_3643 [Tardiphaga sp.]|jgi:hypothetical protein|nr:hypothetical protein [Tardiphaga sp.]